jgi:hypothetical protein
MQYYTLQVKFWFNKIKIKNSHFRYLTVDFRYTTSITSGSQPWTIISGLRIRFLSSNYVITSGLQHLAHNIRFPTTDLFPVSNYGITSGSQSTDYNFRYSIIIKYYTSTQHLPSIQTFLEPKFNMTTNPWKYTKIINILPFISTVLQLFYKPAVCLTGKYDWTKINKMTYLSGNQAYPVIIPCPVFDNYELSPTIYSM